MTTTLNFKNRNIAIVDLETTGLDSKVHEIIDMGLIIINQPDLTIIDTYEAKVKPLNIQTATPEALQLNGYNDQEWQTAIPLTQALQIFIEKTKDCMLCGLL